MYLWWFIHSTRWEAWSSDLLSFTHAFNLSLGFLTFKGLDRMILKVSVLLSLKEKRKRTASGSQPCHIAAFSFRRKAWYSFLLTFWSTLWKLIISKEWIATYRLWVDHSLMKAKMLSTITLRQFRRGITMITQSKLKGSKRFTPTELQLLRTTLSASRREKSLGF